MNACVNELKIRARLGLKALKAGDRTLLERAQAVGGLRLRAPSPWQLRHALDLVAASVGFQHWEQARRVLGGLALPGRDDMGRFWHAPGCDGVLSQWFADHAGAAACHRATAGSSLLPYRRQFVVVGDAYLQALGLPPAAGAGPDLVASYGSALWLDWCRRRLAAPPDTWMRP